MGDVSDFFLQRENFHLFIHLKEIVQSIFFFLVCLFVISMSDALLVGNFWHFLTIFGHFWPFFKCLIDMDILKLLLFLKFFFINYRPFNDKKKVKSKIIGKIGGILSVGLHGFFYSIYRKVTSSRLSRLVAHPSTFLILMKWKFDAYVL